MAFLLVLGIIIAYISLLFFFKKKILDRSNYRGLNYIIGMMVAYAILLGITMLCNEYTWIKMAFQSTSTHIRINKEVLGMVLLLVPAGYSVVLLGYSKEQAKWKDKKIVMLSMALNGIFSFFGILLFDTYLHGVSGKEIYVMIKEIPDFIDWKYMAGAALVCIAFIQLMQYDHFKYNKEEKD